MNNRNSSILVLWTSLAALVAATFALTLYQPISSLPLSSQPLQVDGKMAFAKMAQLSEKFPYRIQGNPNLALAGDWIESEFKSLGYLPHSQTFKERLYDVTYNDLRNIWAEKPGNIHPEEIIIVCAHYDISEKTKFGAMDDASGIGVVLELAKVFQKENPARTLLFLAVNAEELGAHWGARSFIRDFERIKQVKAVLTFDFIAPHQQVGIFQLQDGEKRGFTPLWLRQLSIQSIASIPSLIPDDLPNIMEYIQRATLHPASDHGVFLKAGIPALNWTGKSSEFPKEMNEIHHTLNDRVDAMKPESFRDYGQAAERLVRSIDELKEIPEESTNSNNFKLSSQSFLPGFWVTAIQYLLFLPFFVFGLSQWQNGLLDPKGKHSALMNELKCLSLWSGALMLVYFVLRTFPSANLLPFFELHPGAAKSDVSHSLSYTVILTISGFIAFFYFLFNKVFHHPKTSPDPIQNRLLAQLFLFSFLIALGLLLNPFTTTVFLCAPAYAWMTVYQLTRNRAKGSYISLCLLGIVPFITVFSIMGFMYQNYYVFYYLILCAIYGVFDISTVWVGLSSLIIFFRMLTLLVRSRVTYLAPLLPDL